MVMLDKRNFFPNPRTPPHASNGYLWNLATGRGGDLLTFIFCGLSYGCSLRVTRGAGDSRVSPATSPCGDFGAPPSSSRSFLWGFGCHEGNPSSHYRFYSCSLFRTSPHTTVFDPIFQLGPFRSLFGARFNLLHFCLSSPLAATSFCSSDRDISLRG